MKLNEKKIDLSVVIPCLNEDETIEICIKKAKNSFKKLKIVGEVVVSDNGSTDNSIKICKRNKVTLVHVKEKGYGSALKAGIKKSKSNFILIADADNSYDLNDIKKFYVALKKGYHLVQGCRFKKGGGSIQYNAMPFTHKYIGNPMFTWLLKKLIGSPFNDVYCGIRAFDKRKFEKMYHFSNGMTFAIENLIRFISAKAKLKEVPVILYKDGRIKKKSHLKTISDGLKTLKLIILFIPARIFNFFSFILISIVVYKIVEIFLMRDSLLIKINDIFILLPLALQIFFFGIYTALLRKKINLSNDEKIFNFFKYFNLGRSFILSFLILTLGLLFLIQSKYLYLIKFSIFLFLSSISIIIFINSILISLLELVEEKKI
jgi:glycosyltransferase involved in cell wall biosynthesis